jgi:hypothetical protein
MCNKSCRAQQDADRVLMFVYTAFFEEFDKGLDLCRTYVIGFFGSLIIKPTIQNAAWVAFIPHIF